MLPTVPRAVYWQARRIPSSPHIVLQVWLTGMTAFVADSLLWYNLGQGVWGGVTGLARRGVASQDDDDLARMQSGLCSKLLPVGAAGDAAWAVLWRALVDELYDGDLVGADEREGLLVVDDADRLQPRDLRSPEVFPEVSYPWWHICPAYIPHYMHMYRVYTLSTCILLASGSRLHPCM